MRLHWHAVIHHISITISQQAANNIRPNVSPCSTVSEQRWASSLLRKQKIPLFCSRLLDRKGSKSYPIIYFRGWRGWSANTCSFTLLSDAMKSLSVTVLLSFIVTGMKVFTINTWTPQKHKNLSQWEWCRSALWLSMWRFYLLNGDSAQHPVTTFWHHSMKPKLTIH